MMRELSKVHPFISALRVLVSTLVLGYVPPMKNASHEVQIESATTHFGYRTVQEAEKASLVHGVFDSVADKYDLMNDLLSFGVHRLWKKALVDWLNPRPGMTLVDVGGGTGDITFRFIGRGGGPVVVVDINKDMLARGRDRALDLGIVEGITWLNADAEQLPLQSMTVDAFVVSFCIRNVTHIDRVLDEAKRILKPGGRFICLEFAKVSDPFLSTIYDTYSFKLLPLLGQCIAGDRAAYQYLAESIRNFPDQKRFSTMIEQAGFGNVKVRNLSAGIAALHSAWRV